MANHSGVVCPGRKRSRGEHDASGADTLCNTTSGATNVKVVKHTCADAQAGRLAVDDLSVRFHTCYVPQGHRHKLWNFNDCGRRHPTTGGFDPDANVMVWQTGTAANGGILPSIRARLHSIARLRLRAKRLVSLGVCEKVHETYSQMHWPCGDGGRDWNNPLLMGMLVRHLDNPSSCGSLPSG
jgi:hypothetical protein